jgi:hypothetical protein
MTTIKSFLNGRLRKNQCVSRELNSNIVRLKDQIKHNEQQLEAIATTDDKLKQLATDFPDTEVVLTRYSDTEIIVLPNPLFAAKPN